MCDDRFVLMLTSITAAGTIDVPSGRGVPVPIITTRAVPFGFIANRSVEPHIGRRDDLGPFRPVGLDPRADLGADGSDWRYVHAAQSLDHIRMLERSRHLALQQRRDRLGKPGRRKKDMI